jgi:hypothetical protein
MNLKYILLFLLMGLLSSSLMGDGTPSGTDVRNQAILSFGDDENALVDIVSNVDNFVVDTKIDLVVSTLDVSAVQTQLGKVSVVLKFKVANQGNSIQDFSLSSLRSSNRAFGVKDNFDAENIRVFVDVNNNGQYDEGDDATYIDELGIDEEKVVFILADMPSSGIADGSIAVYDLQAQVAKGGAIGLQGDDIISDDRDKEDNPLTVQIVFADGEGSVTGDTPKDGKHSSVDAFKISIANMSIQKSSVVISDPINGNTNPKRVPGALIRHCITIQNSGSADVKYVNISDDIDESKFDISNFTKTDIRIYSLSEPFSCSSASEKATISSNAIINSSNGNIKISLGGVSANSAKSIYYDLSIF